jgi:general secretion pathway protein G
MRVLKKRARGFTLIEVMVVVVIMAILAAIVVPRIMTRPDQAKKVKARTDIGAITNALDLYNLDNGQYPTQDQGIKALVSKPTMAPVPSNYAQGGYLKNLPIDPWGHPYHYANPSKHGATVDVFTYGANNKSGGTGINAEIGSWNLNRPVGGSAGANQTNTNKAST